MSKRALPRWERITPAGDTPLLLPRAPQGALRERWRAEGVAIWISEGIVLLEAHDRSLEGRDPATGELLWSVASVRPPARDLDEDERASALAWAAAPWGAVELCARHQAPFVYGRVRRGSAREIVGRREAEVELTVQMLLPEGGLWGLDRAAPEVVLERADPGRPLCDTDVTFGEWDEDLLALSLELGARMFGLRWRDADEDWAIFLVGGGGDVPGLLGPAGWSPGLEDPFVREPEADPLCCPGPDGSQFTIDLPTGRLLHTDAKGALQREINLPGGLDGRRLIGVDGAVVVVGHRGPDLTCYCVPWNADWNAPYWEPWRTEWLPEDVLYEDGRFQVTVWSDRHSSDLNCQLTLAGGQLYLQRGDDALVVYGSSA